MKSTMQNEIYQEAGYILVVIMFLLLVLTVIGIAAIHTTSIEMQISGNTKKIVEDFYASEGALITALETTDLWLSDAFLEKGEAAAWSGHVDFDGDGAMDALVEIRCVMPNPSAIAALSEAANDIPADRHIESPPIGSGYSVRNFDIRKYAVTVTALQGGVVLQAGSWKVFNKH